MSQVGGYGLILYDIDLSELIDYRAVTTCSVVVETKDAQGEWWISGNRQKTETRYVVKLLPYALFILNKYRGLTGDGRVFAMSTLDSIDDSLKNIARECGIDKQLSFHLARHTYATTICLSNGVSLETLSKMLGHKNITTTQIYAKVTPPMIDREVTMLREKLATKFSV